MGLLSKFLGRGWTAAEYIGLNFNRIETSASETEIRVHIAVFSEHQDLLAIKDAVYDGDIVIIDIPRNITSDKKMKHIADELREAVSDVGGDIIQKDDEQLVITPTGVKISREKLGH